ncbi:MAG: hypothetical protein ACO3Y3_07975 [Phycisphaerales bacterium]
MRSITMCRTTVLAAVAALPALAFAAPASAPEATETEVGAWIVGDASFESPRFTKAVRIDGLDVADVASRFASMPAGRRAAYSERILAGFVGDEGDRVVVSGRITDHVGPWLDAASKRTRLEFEQLAKELVSRGLSIDALLLGGENPLSAEKLDTADDLVWMAIRNDRRFEEIVSAELSLAGAMSPANPQWRAWNEFADVTIAKAIDASVATPLREAGAAASIAVPVTVGIGRSELDAMPIAIRMYGSFDEADAGGATTAFDVLADELELAVKASRGGRTLQPWVRPYSHAGTRGERSAVAGTLLWDELVRHATLLGNGRVGFAETRSRDLAAPDASRFAAVLDGVAEEFAGGASISSTDASIRRGQGFVAVGVPTASGETLWRISFSPGIGGVDVEIDGGGLRVERRRGESGAWLRTAADSRIEFFDRAFARNEATTGGGLLAAPTSKPQGKVGPLLSGGPGGGTTLVGSGVADLNGDGVVDGADLAIHLAGGGDSAWGGVSDLNGDGVVDGADMAIQLSGGLDPNWNGTGWDDLNGDGVVDGADLAISLGDGASGEPWNGTGWEDLNGDGVNDGADLAINLAGGGSPSAIAGDLNGDGVVDGADLAIELAGTNPPAIDIKANRPDLGSRVFDRVDRSLRIPRGGDVDGGVSTTSDHGSSDDPVAPGGGDQSSGSSPSDSPSTQPSVDPTVPITPPAPPAAPAPRILTNELPIPELASQFEAAGCKVFRCVYQHVVDPGATSGLIDADAVLAALSQELSPSSTEFVMLDFEHPFCDVLSSHLTFPNGEPHPQYEQTVATMVNLVTRLREAFPGVKWTYYGIPSLRYWPRNTNGAARNWSNIESPCREAQYQRTKEVYGPIVQVLDWVSPTAYDIYDSAMYTLEQMPQVTARETAWRMAIAEYCVRLREEFDLGNRPIIPTVNYTYSQVGTREYTGKVVPLEELMRDQVQPLLAGGVDGIAIWHSTRWRTAIATGSNPHEQQTTFRTAMARNFFDSPDADAAEAAISNMGFSGWEDPGLRQHLLARQSEQILERVAAIASALEAGGE